MVVRPWCLLSVVFAVGCSSDPGAQTAASPEPASGLEAPGKDAGIATVEAAPGTSVEHGTMVDYETLKPVQGLTISDNGVSATTDAKGQWSLTVPAGSTLRPTVTGSTYSRLLFPDMTAMATEIDFSTVVVPDTSTDNLEELLLGMDTTKALVQVLIVTRPSCASAAGGTLSVVSPSGASVRYFDSHSASPNTMLTSFQDVAPSRPVAAVYDVDPSATLSLQVSHPTCKQSAFPVTYGGRSYPGTMRLSPAEPGGVSAAIVIFLE